MQNYQNCYKSISSKKTTKYSRHNFINSAHDEISSSTCIQNSKFLYLCSLPLSLSVIHSFHSHTYTHILSWAINEMITIIIVLSSRELNIKKKCVFLSSTNGVNVQSAGLSAISCKLKKNRIRRRRRWKEKDKNSFPTDRTSTVNIFMQRPSHTALCWWLWNISKCDFLPSSSWFNSLSSRHI